MAVNTQLIEGSLFNYTDVPIVCRSSRKTYHVLHGADLPVVITHESCMCNEELAFLNRHMLADVKCSRDGKGFKVEDENPGAIKNTLRKLFDKIGDHKVDLKPMIDIVYKYHGRFRRRYMKAFYYLSKYPIMEKHFINQCFLKDDKYHQGDLDTAFKIKAPRAIQYQSPEATLFKAQLVMPVEKQLYEILDVHGLRIFTKGLNQRDVAQLMVNGYNSVNNAICVENDYTSFDAHVTTKWLKITHKYMLQYCPAQHYSVFKKAFKHDLKVRGYTTNGIPYRINGTLTSGSIDTSLKGNLINYLIVYTIMNQLSIPESAFKFICNGDDSVLFLDRMYLEKYLSVNFNDYGMDAKIILRDSLFEVEFCQAKLVYTPVGFNLVRNPTRMFTRIGWMMIKRNKKYIRSYVKTVIMGEMALNYKVPVLYPILRSMYKTISSKVELIHLDTYVDEIYRQEKHWGFDDPYNFSDKYDCNLYAAYPDFIPPDPIKFMSGVSVDNDDMAYDLLLSSLLRNRVDCVRTLKQQIYIDYNVKH